MRKAVFLFILSAFGLQSAVLHADQVSQVRKAIERSTLNQPGTKPFHLKATIAPSFERDKDSGRTGEVEIWWLSPYKWRRDIRSSEFHQIEIVTDGKDWQKNEGDYFPEWLRETAIELISPVPDAEAVLQRVKDADARQLHFQTKQGVVSQTNIDWVTDTGTAEVKNIQRWSIALNPDNGRLLYTYGFGWGSEFKDYEKFHGLMIARTVNHGTPQVTAKVVILEDLASAPETLFEISKTQQAGAQLQTQLISETDLRKNLETTRPVSWPPLQDGVLEGNVTSWILVDRDGKVREMDGIVSENSAINDTGRQAIMNLHFKPFILNGAPVQVYSQITLPFKTTRPSGTDSFLSAKEYFERGRATGFPAAQPSGGYTLQAEFQLRDKDGQLEKGKYEDTWLSDSQWRREAWLGSSHFARTRSGDKRYRLAEGEQAALLEFLFRVLEPIPAIDTFVESDWRIRRDSVNGSSAIRLLSGYESPEGKLDPTQARGYWFDDRGLLLKTYFKGVETRRAEFQPFGTTQVARRIDVLKDDKLAILISVTRVSPLADAPESRFKLPGHEWERIFSPNRKYERQFTDEVR